MYFVFYFRQQEFEEKGAEGRDYFVIQIYLIFEFQVGNRKSVDSKDLFWNLFKNIQIASIRKAGDSYSDIDTNMETSAHLFHLKK